jgi:hypothetical protein
MRTAALKKISEHGGPMVLGSGMTLLAITLVTSAGHGGITATPQPSHAPTAPVTTAPPATTPVKPPRPRPSTSAPSSGPPVGHVVAESAPHSTSIGPQRTSGTTPSEPAPQPTAAQPSTTRCDVGVAALTLDACLRLGGSR